MVSDRTVLPQAVLLDLDGTLVDTEDLWWQTEVELFAGWGYRLEETSRAVVAGGPMARVVDHLLRTTGVDLTPAALTALIQDGYLARLAGGTPLMAGARELLRLLGDHGIPVALVSAAERRVVDIVMGTVGSQHFAVTVAGDEVDRNKPHPDPYITAVEALGVDPARCVAVEDSMTGVLSAEAAGCPVIAVPSVAPITPGPGRLVLDSLLHIDLAALGRIANYRQILEKT
ncbi:HAD family hydrolase [Kitasatospora cineracea]|uniref:HAD family hydrolase n=1 Tax=Kitasatospora cineracea TaxID=88074 RepID=UPI0033D25B13